MTSAGITQFGSEDFYRRVFDATADGVLVVDQQGTVCLANRQSEALFGYTAAELIGMRVENLMPERFRNLHVGHRGAYHAQPRARPMGANLALWGLRKDGSEFPLDISLSPIAEGGAAYVCVTIRDASERSVTETLRLRAGQADAVARFGQRALAGADLATLKQEACAIVKEVLHVDQVVIVEPLGPDKPFLFTAGVGWKDGVVGHQVSPPGPGVLSGYAMMAGVPVIVTDFATETRFDAPVLKSLGIVSSLACLIPGGEHALGVIGAHSLTKRTFTQDDANFVQGITNTLGAAIERQRIADRLNQSQKLEALGQLTGGVAHDFNNLLTVVSGNLQLLEDRMQDDPVSSKLARNASHAVRRGVELTSKLLAFGRRQTLQPRPIDLKQLLPAFSDMLRRTLGEHIEIATVLDADIPFALADPGMLETSLLNLALNARDAMPRGGHLTLEATSVNISARGSMDDISITQRTVDPAPGATPDGGANEPELKPGRYTLISVSDTGSGIAPDVLGHVFEPFFTTKGAGKGSGLGLAMVYGFAKQSGGNITIYSELGIGTSVKLYLPVSAAAPIARPARPGIAALRGSETILVVEDDDEVRNVAVAFLHDLGYTVLEASSAEAALEILDAQADIALLFTDVVLRGTMKGPELARLALERRPKLKVLYTSGYASGALAASSGLGSDVEMLSKPYRREQLGEKLRQLLDDSQRRTG